MTEQIQSSVRPPPAPRALPRRARPRGDRPRLSVFRSWQAHLCAGHRRRDGHDPGGGLDARQGPARERSRPAPTRRRGGGRQADRRARQGRRRQAGRVRPRRLSVSWPGQGPGRRRPRGRPGFLRELATWHAHAWRGSGGDPAARTRSATATAAAATSENELDRKARQHQPRRQGGEGRPALRLCGARRRRRPQGPGRLWRGQGARSARGDPQGDRAGARGMIRVPLREGRTLHHDIIGRYGAGEVIVRAAQPGTGIIAGGPMRAIFEALGVQDVVAKSVGTLQPAQHDQGDLRRARAAGQARARWRRARGKKVGEILGRRDDRRPKRARRTTDGGQEDRDGHPDRQPDRPPHDQHATLKGLGLNKLHRSRVARGHAGGARHDRQGEASGAGRRGRHVRQLATQAADRSRRYGR